MTLSFASILFLIFLVLKLTHFIAWSWWWITAPLWAGLAIFLVIMLGAVLIGLIAASVGTIFDRK